MSNKTIYGTDQNDFIDASYENGTSWGDRVEAHLLLQVVAGGGVRGSDGPRRSQRLLLLGGTSMQRRQAGQCYVSPCARLVSLDAHGTYEKADGH